VTRDGMVTTTDRGRVVKVVLQQDTAEADLRADLDAVARAVGDGGSAVQFVVGYDLRGVRALDVQRVQLIIDLHHRLCARLCRIGFVADVALVRGHAIVVGSSVKKLPWKVFATEEPFLKWCQEAAI
jgi:hypothetical protein